MASTRDILEDRLVELLYADGELAPEEVERLEAELDAYPDLRARLEEWRALRRALVDEALPDPDPQVHYNVLREARKLAAEREEAKAPRWLLWLESLTLGPAFAGAAVAMVALGGLVFSLRSSDEAPAMAPAMERAAEPVAATAPPAGAAADSKLAKTAAPRPEEAPAPVAEAVGAEPPPVATERSSRSLATGDSLKDPFGSLAGGRAEEQKGGAAKDDGFAFGTRGAARGNGSSNSGAESARSRAPASPKAERKPVAKAKKKRRPAPSKKAPTAQKPSFAPPPPPADRAEPAPEPEPEPLADDFDGPAGGEGAGWGDVDEPVEVAPQQQAAPAAEPAPAPAPRRSSASGAQRETYGLENDVDALDAPARPGGADEASALLDDGAIGEAEAEEVQEYAARDAEQAPAAVETATKDTAAKEKAEPSRTRRQDTAGPNAELAEARRLRSARDWRRAVQQYERFIRGAAQHPQVGRAMVEAAGVYETIGDLDRADALYRRAAAFGGATGDQAREGRKRIAERRAQQRSKKAAPDVLKK